MLVLSHIQHQNATPWVLCILPTEHHQIPVIDSSLLLYDSIYYSNLSLASNTTMDIATALFVAAYIITGYLTKLSMTSPHIPKNAYAHDRTSRVVTPQRLAVRRFITISMIAYPIVLALAFPAPSPSFICPHPQNLNPKIFSWSLYTVTCLGLISIIGSPLRLAAYRGLGQNFSYQLAKPDKLNTSGLYAYVQHPSYVGLILVVAGNLALFWRWDGALGCWIGEGFRGALNGWGGVVLASLVVIFMSGVRVRVLDEERMLKETFGEEWVRWHQRTSRFIPGVF